MKRVIFLLLAFSFSLIWAVTPSGDWHLDELGDGSYPYHLDDSTITNHKGVAHDTPTTGRNKGKVCSALDFSANSIDDTVILRSDAINGAGDFTISFWLKGGNSHQRSLLSGARPGYNNALLFWFDSPTKFTPYISSEQDSYDIPDITDGNWHHFVFRRNGDEGCVFVDRRGTVLNPQGTKICHSVSSSTIYVKSLLLGQEQDNTGGNLDINQDWEGLVDEVLFFKDALSDQQIMDIYRNENNGKNWDGSSRTCPSGTPSAPHTDNDYYDYHFDELAWNGTNGEIKEAHNSKHGTGHSVKSVKGKLCQAMDLTPDGTSDYATLYKDAFDDTEDFTVSIWHKGSSKSGHALLSGARAGQDNELLEWFSNNSDSGFNMYGHIDGDKKRYTKSNHTIFDGEWHNIVWNMYQQKGCIYVDGRKERCSYYDTSHKLEIDSLILGQDQDSVGGGFDGSQDWQGIVDELLIFRKALTDSEIKTGYNNQNAGKNWDGSARVCPYPKIVKTSCIIDDPINGTNNPKRITGATIRYAIEAQNPNTADINDVTADDNLSNHLDSSTITTPKVINDSCGDCVSLSGGNSGSSSVNGNEVKVDFGTIDGGTLSSPTKKCGYFDVKIK